MRLVALFVILVNIYGTACLAQKIDNLASFRAIRSSQYVRLNYENDLFTGADHNYTQGFSLELVMPFLKSNPINYLFYKPKKAEINFGGI